MATLTQIRRSKAFLAVALVFALVALTVAGCPLRLTRPGLTIVLWDGPRWADESGNRYHWVQQKIDEFEASHPFVEVVLVPVEWNDLQSLMAAAKEAGRLPDIAPLDLSAGGITPADLDAGLLEPVDDAVADRDDISPRALAAYTYGGHLWGFPQTMTGHTLLLNLDLFAERGVTPPANGAWTWDEFAAACRRLTFDRDGDGKTDVWGFATYVLPGYYEAWPFLYADGSRPLSDDLSKYTFDTPEAVAALKRLTDLVLVDKAAHPLTGSAAARNVFELFADKDKQQVAIEPWSAWAIDYLKTQDKAIKNFAVAAYPTGSSGGTAPQQPTSGSTASEPLTIGGTGGYVVFRQSDSYRRSQVVALANYLTSVEAQYELARGYHVFPARRKALELDPFAGDPVYQKAADIIFHAESLPRHPRWPEIERAIQREVQMALLGIKSPEEALKDAGEVITPLLAESAPPASSETPGSAPSGSTAPSGTSGST